MLEVIFIIVGILIIGTLFDKWEKRKKEKSKPSTFKKESLDQNKIDFNTILNNYKRIYGEKKYNKILNDISKSKHTDQFIQDLLRNKQIPTGEELISSVSNNLKYSFSKGETLLIATIILYREWLETLSIVDALPNKRKLKKIEKEIINKIKEMSFNFDYSLLSKPTEIKKTSNNLEKIPFPHFGKAFITDVMREINFETDEEYTGSFTMGLFEFSKDSIKNNYDDQKGNIAHDKDDLPGFKKAWDYLGFDGNEYIFVDEDGLKWYINDESIIFQDIEKKVSYKFEISERSLDNSNLNNNKKAVKDSSDITTSKRKDCITNGTYHSLYGKFIVKFFPNGKFKSWREKKDGNTVNNSSGKWSFINANTVKRDFDPNPSGVTHDYIQIKSCTQIKIGKTLYFRR